ncbi:MAG TPA: phage tail tape measure protein, partial [Propionibacteriaceae bacterium]|nr:phage tail tape measure protein [Propionibacteriaceae bacterium]
MAKRKIEVQIVGDSKSLERAFNRSGKAGKSFGRDIAGTSRHIARNVGLIGAAVGGVAIAASKAFSSFEGSMRKITGLVGVSRKQVDAWQEPLLKLGPEVAKSPTELADALFFVTSAGLRGQKALDALSVSAHAAAAGLGETKTVADAITSAINAYGQANLSAAKAGDVLVATVREGKTAADQLAPVIGNIAALGAQLG